MERIAGLFSLRDHKENRCPGRLEGICDQLAHGHATYRQRLSLGQVHMAVMHRRHATSSDQDTPLPHSPCGQLWIAFNGKLSNAAMLRQELLTQGYALNASSDADLVVHAFHAWGDASLSRLKGMFAFVVYDCQTNTMTLVRDPLGRKPLYYMHRHGDLCFASEIKPLLHEMASPQPNREALIEWFLYGIALTPEAFFQGIYTVPPGHFLKIQSGRMLGPMPYYSVLSEVDVALYQHLDQQSEATVMATLAAELHRSVTACLDLEVPSGTLLSGGLDSSLMTALAIRQTEVSAFHVSSADDPQMDERRYAEDVAVHLRVPLVCHPMDFDTFARHFPSAVYLNELPLTHIQSVGVYFGFKLAHQHGIQTLLMGDGADAVMGGKWSRYGRQRQLFYLERLFAYLPKRLQRTVELTVFAHHGMHVNSSFTQHLRDVIPFFDRYRRQGPYLQCEEAYEFVDDAVERSIHATKLADLMTQTLHWFFQQGDRFGMAQDLLYQAPYVDPHLIKLTVNLPWRYHTRGTTEKWGLKQVSAPLLPRRIIYRKKAPWDLPGHRYLPALARPELFKSGFCLETLDLHPKAVAEMCQAPERFLPALFHLVNLEIWGRLFFLHQPVGELTEQMVQFAAGGA